MSEQNKPKKVVSEVQSAAEIHATLLLAFTKYIITIVLWTLAINTHPLSLSLSLACLFSPSFLSLKAALIAFILILPPICRLAASTTHL